MWTSCKLGELADIIMGQSPSGVYCNNSSKGVPLLNGPTEFGFHHPIPVQYTIDPKKFARKGDILFCVRGSTTGCMNWADQDYAIGRGIAAIRAKQDINIQHFIRASIEAELTNLLLIATGSTFPNVSREQLCNFTVSNPPLHIQQRIAEILGALDDKIECNRRINETLEKMAIALYKHWFVNNPEDYESCPLTDFIDINPTIHIPKDKEIPYVDMKSLPINSMSVIDTDIIKRVFTSGSKFKNGDTLLARITPCLENGKTAFVDFLENNEAGYGSTEFIVMRAKNNVSPQFVYCCARDEDFRIHAISSMTGTSGRQRVEHSCFSRFSVNRFSNQVMQDFHIKTDVWFKQIRANVKEMFILSRTRDYLLPKLLSGEIEVQEAAKQVSNPVSFLDVARSIDLKGPADFSENLDEYLYGDKEL